MIGSKKKKTVYLGLVVMMFFILFTQISYFSDDWLWGSYKSLRIFLGSFSDPSNPWHDYPNNGRYLGNFLGFIGANFFFIRNLIMTGVVCLIIYGIGNICDITAGLAPDPFVSVFLPACLLVLSPGGYFEQTIAWSSSFMNYAVPIAIFLILLQKTFTQKAKAPFHILFLFLPLLSALFMENLTVGSVLFIVLWIIYRLLQREKPNVNDWAWLIGAVLGLILMFSDDGYRQVFEATPNKSVWHAHTGSLILMLQTGFQTFRSHFVFLIFRGYSLFNLLGALAMFIVCLSSESTDKKLRIILRSLGLGECLIGCYFFIRQLEPSWKVFRNYTGIFESAAALLFVLIIPAVELLLPCSRKQKERMFFTWLFMICITAPLLVAEPLTARVFFPTYIISLVIWCGFIWIILSRQWKMTDIQIGKWLRLGLIGLFLLGWGFRISIYAVESHYEKERVKYIRYQESIGAYPILLPRMPYEEYIIVSWPDGDRWQERYKRFYGLNLDSKYELISFDKWKEQSGSG